MSAAIRTSWKTLPLPSQREQLAFTALYTDARAERMLAGHIPDDMDDRWFVYAEEGWVYFLRSWTGACIFGLKLDGSSAGVRITDSWVSRDEKQYQCISLEQDRKMLASLIERYFPEID